MCRGPVEGGTAPSKIIRLKKKKKVGGGELPGRGLPWRGRKGGDGRERRREELGGELNFVNGVFLRASHSALKAKPPG